MTEEEAMLRAREAVKATPRLGLHEGIEDYAAEVAKRALLDIDKPLPVDPDMEALREIFAACERAVHSPVDIDADNAEAGKLDGKLQVALPILRKHIEARAKG